MQIKINEICLPWLSMANSLADTKTQACSSLNISQYLDRQSEGTKQNVVYKKPEEIGAFSLDGRRKFHNDSSELAFIKDDRYFKEPMNLNDGFKDRSIKRDENVKERLGNILRWIVSNSHRFDTPGGTSSKQSLGQIPEIVLWRGHMTKVMCTPYETHDGWLMAAQKIGSTIYISEVETEEAKKKRLGRTEKEKLMMYWGVRFETYMTESCHRLSNQETEPKKKAHREESDIVVNTNKAYCSILRGRVNSHTILFSGEVDCCQRINTSLHPPDNYIELKTSREFSSQKQEDNFHRYKTLKWWAQSYLAGVPLIICGFRDDQGIVVDVRQYRTLELPRMVRRLRNAWDPNLCLSFLDDFFTHVKKVFNNKGNETTVILFSWNPGKQEILCERHDIPTKHSFLPEWYLTSLKYSNLSVK